jgi:hypothetical protein
MTRRLTGVAMAVVVALAAPGCDRPADEPAPGGEPPEAALERPVEREVALTRDADTLAVERYVNLDGNIHGELIDGESGDRVRYSATTGPDALIIRLEVEAYRPEDVSPRERIILTVEGDTLRVEAHENGAVDKRATRLPQGTLLYLNPSVALLEQMLRRARVVGEDEVNMAVLTVAAGEAPQLEWPVITWMGGDSVRIFVAEDSQIHAEVGADGLIRGGVNPPQNIRLERIH